MLMWILTVLAVITGVKGFSNGNFPQVCDSMSVQHDIGGPPFQPQTPPIPYEIDVLTGDPFTVILRGRQSTDNFRGFMLEGRRKTDDSIVGRFIEADTSTIRFLTCSEVEGSAVSNRNNAIKTEIRVNWTSGGSDEDIVFRATVVQRFNIFWEGITKNVSFATTTPPQPSTELSTTTLSTTTTPPQPSTEVSTTTLSTTTTPPQPSTELSTTTLSTTTDPTTTTEPSTSTSPTEPSPTATTEPNITSPTQPSPTTTGPNVTSPTQPSLTTTGPNVTSPTQPSLTTTGPNVTSPTEPGPTATTEPNITSPTQPSSTTTGPNVTSPTEPSPTATTEPNITSPTQPSSTTTGPNVTSPTEPGPTATTEPNITSPTQLSSTTTGPNVTSPTELRPTATTEPSTSNPNLTTTVINEGIFNSTDPEPGNFSVRDVIGLVAADLAVKNIKMGNSHIITVALPNSPCSYGMNKASKIILGFLCMALEISAIAIHRLTDPDVTVTALLGVVIGINFIELMICCLLIGRTHELKEIFDTADHVCSVIHNMFAIAVLFVVVPELSQKVMAGWTAWIFLYIIFYSLTIHTRACLCNGTTGNSRNFEQNTGQNRKEKQLCAAKVAAIIVSVIFILGSVAFAVAIMVL